MSEAAQTTEQAEQPEVTTRSTIKEPTGVRREPKPGSKKDIVYQAGITEEGGDIKALSEQMGCTTSNVRQHVAQCHTKLGFGYKIEGDRFWITGDPTESWATQAAEKEAAQAAKKAEKAEEKAKTDPDVSSEGPESDEDFLE
ncbi:MAG: hypothetical protein ACYSUL_14110 [Planctomycetota bacterium]|jgi:hypothetical protein